MLALMFDRRFKSMRLISMFMGHENVTLVVVEYNEKLLLPLLMEENQIFMPNKVETTFNLHSKSNYEGLFHTSTITDTYKDIVSRELVGFQWVLIDVKSCKCVLYWWCKKKHKFITIILLMCHILCILVSQFDFFIFFPIVGILRALH
jgi:hypothetical protein